MNVSPRLASSKQVSFKLSWSDRLACSSTARSRVPLELVHLRMGREFKFRWACRRAQCQSGSDLTGFTRNFFLNGCDVRALQRIVLRDAISRPAGFLSDLLLWSKESTAREGAGDGKKDKSSFH